MAIGFRPNLGNMFPGVISGYGGGTFNPSQGGLQRVQNPLEQPMPPVAPESGAPRKGAFSKGGDGWKILGIIGDALQTAGGGQATYAPYVRGLQEQQAEEEKFRQQLQARAQQAAQDRQNKLEDAMKLRRFDAQNPQPTNAEREFQFARSQPGMESLSYQDFVTNYYRPQFFEQGGQRYQVQHGLPQGYDPNEWEVVPGDAGGNASDGF